MCNRYTQPLRHRTAARQGPSILILIGRPQVGRAELLCAALYAAALEALCRALDRSDGRSAGRSVGHDAAWTLASLALATAAMLAKVKRTLSSGLQTNPKR